MRADCKEYIIEYLKENKKAFQAELISRTSINLRIPKDAVLETLNAIDGNEVFSYFQNDDKNIDFKVYELR